MEMRLNEVGLGNEKTLLKGEENVSVLKEVVRSLTSAVSTLQTIKDLETNAFFKSLEAGFPEGGLDFHEAKRQYEINLVKQALRETNGHQANAAKLLRMRVSTLNSIIKKHKIAYK